MENSLTIEEWNAFIGEQYNAPLSALSLKIAHFDPQYLPHSAEVTAGALEVSAAVWGTRASLSATQ